MYILISKPGHYDSTKHYQNVYNYTQYYSSQIEIVLSRFPHCTLLNVWTEPLKWFYSSSVLLFVY